MVTIRTRRGALLASLMALQWLAGVNCGGVEQESSPSSSSSSPQSSPEERVAPAAVPSDPDLKAEDGFLTDPHAEAITQEGAGLAGSSGDLASDLGIEPPHTVTSEEERLSNDGARAESDPSDMPTSEVTEDQTHEGESIHQGFTDEASPRSSVETESGYEQSQHAPLSPEPSIEPSPDDAEPSDAETEPGDTSSGDSGNLDYLESDDTLAIGDILQDSSDESIESEEESIQETTTEDQQPRLASADPGTVASDSPLIEETTEDASYGDGTSETGADADLTSAGADFRPYCGVWGTLQNRRPYDISLLYDFFQFDVLGNKTEFQFTDPKFEATKITNAAFGQARRDESEVSEKPSNEFVDGLDDIDKFFEGVEPPDELDVGAGSSIQEVLMGQGSRIIIKRLKMGIGFVSQAFEKTKVRAVERIQANAANLKMPDKEKLITAGHWIAEHSRRLVRATRRLFDSVFEGNFDSILDSFGSDEEDFSFDYDSPLISAAEATAEADPAFDSRPDASLAARTDRSGSPKNDADTEMEELLRLMNLSSNPSSASPSPVSDEASNPVPSVSAQNQAVDQEMNDLLRQLGL